MRIWVVLGSAHRLTAPHKPHNSLYIIDDRGEIVDRYDKMFCAGDRSGESGDLAHYSSGNHFGVVPWSATTTVTPSFNSTPEAQPGGSDTGRHYARDDDRRGREQPRLGFFVLASEVDTEEEIYDSTVDWRDRAMDGVLHSGTLVRDERSEERTRL